MKRIIIISAIVILPILLLGQRVELATIEKAAINVHKLYFPARLSNEIKKVNSFSSQMEEDLLHVVEYESGGFSIISGDWSVDPILGYSTTGVYDTLTMPPGLVYLIRRYQWDMESVREDTTTMQTKSGSLEEDAWDKLLNAFEGSNPRSGGAQQGDVLIQTLWGQSDGDKNIGDITFNHFCPPKPNGDAGNSPAGCTAVAMAQVLYYWDCQVNPTGYREYEHKGNTLKADFGNTIYDWGSMLYVDTKGDTLYDIANEQNSLLIYHAGVSCKMNYKNQWSYAHPKQAKEALVTYWGMKPEANVKRRIGHLRKWGDMLRDEIIAGRPIIYSGFGFDFNGLSQGEWSDLAGGHSWVVDGFDSNDLFHCNWGWRGYCDGWYSLKKFAPHDENTDTDRGNYNFWEMAIFNIEPVQPAKVGIPQITSGIQTFNVNGHTITADVPWGATSYDWVAEDALIESDGSNTATLYAASTTPVKVRAYNELCDCYSDYSTQNVVIDGGPYISGDYSQEAPAEGEELLQNYSIKQMVSGATGVTWSLSNTTDFAIVSTDHERVVVRSNSYEKKGLLKARIHLHGYDDLFLEANITSNYWDINGPLTFSCNTDKVSSSVIFPNTESIQWTTSPSIQIVSGANTSEAMMTGITNDEDAWVQLEVVQDGVTYTKKQSVQVVRPSSLQLEVGGTWTENGKRKALIHAKTTPTGKHESFAYHWSISGERTDYDGMISIVEFRIEPCAPTEAIIDKPGFGDGSVIIINNGNSHISSSSPTVEDGGMPLPDVPPAIPEDDPSYAIATFPPGKDATIQCRFTSSCGELTASTFISKYGPAAAPSYSASYNRSTRSVQLHREDADVPTAGQTEDNYQLKLYDNFGLVRTLDFDPTERTVYLPLDGLPDGSYYVNVVDDQGEVICRQYISAY